MSIWVAYLLAGIQPGIQPCSCTDKLVGELEYMSNISQPNNTKVGVWVKILLNHPESARSERTMGYIFESNDNYTAFLFRDAGNTLNESGYLIRYYDKNANGLVDTGDMLHVWGKNLSGCAVAFTVSGYSGNAELNIP